MENRSQTVAIAVVGLLLLVVPVVLAAPLQTAQEPAVNDPEQSDLSPSFKSVSADHAAPGDLLEYTIQIINAGPLPTLASLEDVIPETLDFVPGSEWASSGFVWFADGVLQWEGEVLPLPDEVQVTFSATVNPVAAAGQPIVNHVVIWDLGSGMFFDREAITIGTTHFTGLDNPGKTAVDGGGIGSGGYCGPWECLWFECNDPCNEFT